MARFIVGLLALLAMLRLCLGGYMTFKVIQTHNLKGFAISEALGFVASSALLVALFAWLFRKLAPKDA